MAPQPPGPGFPLQAPSVKISTPGGARGRLSGIDSISGRTADVAVKPQLLQEFQRVLWPHQRTRGLVEPVVEPGQQETQRAAAREKGQGGEFGRVKRPNFTVTPD